MLFGKVFVDCSSTCGVVEIAQVRVKPSVTSSNLLSQNLESCFCRLSNGAIDIVIFVVGDLRVIADRADLDQLLDRCIAS